MTFSTARTGEGNASHRTPNKGSPGADLYTFRAPRWADLTQCPVCGTTPDDFGACDYCGAEGHVFKDMNYDA